MAAIAQFVSQFAPNLGEEAATGSAAVPAEVGVQDGVVAKYRAYLHNMGKSGGRVPEPVGLTEAGTARLQASGFWAQASAKPSDVTDVHCRAAAAAMLFGDDASSSAAPAPELVDDVVAVALCCRHILPRDAGDALYVLVLGDPTCSGRAERV